jgi:methyl-accepting chemotaxis protein
MTDQKLDQLLSAAERIEYQVARIAEATAEFRFDLAEIKAMLQKQSEITQQQAETAVRLVSIVERQAQIVEMLLGDRFEEN